MSRLYGLLVDEEGCEKGEIDQGMNDRLMIQEGCSIKVRGQNKHWFLEQSDEFGKQTTESPLGQDGMYKRKKYEHHLNTGTIN